MTERTSRRVANLVAAILVSACAAGVVLASTTLAMVLGGAFAVIAVLVVRAAWRHARVARALAADSRPGSVEGVAVRWRELPIPAAVAGLQHPTIFCDPTLARRLAADELRAVVLHERGHQRRRDPLRLVVLAAVNPLVGWCRTGRGWLERRVARVEIRADRSALESGSSRPDLVRALLKLGNTDVEHATVGFSSAVELRLRALVDADPAPPSASLWRSALLAAPGVAVLCAIAAAHHLAMAAEGVGCVLAGC